MIANAGKQGSGVLATIVGLVTILFGATGVFVQLQSALDRIWNVEPKPGAGIWGFIRTRMISFGMVLGIGFLLLVSLVVTRGGGGDRQPGRRACCRAARRSSQVLTFVVSFAARSPCSSP